VRDMLPKTDVVQILSHASVFACPSIYEPLGIVNLEAMACQAPVVATATGGIPEVVDDGVTGLLVPFEPVADASRAPADPARFSADIARRVNELLADPARAKAMGQAGRRRALEHFDWGAIAVQTMDVYRRLTG
jgi:alpha-maltose-1-phosphate synthase